MKRGQMKLSFGMIFSIFLIILFIVFAFYAITKFLKMQQVLQVETFVENLQRDVNEIRGSPGSAEETYPLPKKVERICFTDNEFDNLIIKFAKTTEDKNIENINILNITAERDPYCIQNVDGKVKLIISRDSREDLVTITKQ